MKFFSFFFFLLRGATLTSRYTTSQKEVSPAFSTKHKLDGIVVPYLPPNVNAGTWFYQDWSEKREEKAEKERRRKEKK